MCCTCTQLVYSRWHRRAALAGSSAINSPHFWVPPVPLALPWRRKVKLMNYSLLEHSHQYMPSLLPVLLQSLNLLYTVGLPWFHNCIKEKVYHNVCKHVCMAGNNLPYNKLGNCTNNAQSRGSFRKIVKRGQKRGARFCQGDMNAPLCPPPPSNCMVRSR